MDEDLSCPLDQVIQKDPDTIVGSGGEPRIAHGGAGV
jgi:hypothetical protein